MTINISKQSSRNHPSTASRGSAVLIILVLLACMAIILAANSATLASLKQELKLIDQQQQKKYGPGARH